MKIKIEDNRKWINYSELENGDLFYSFDYKIFLKIPEFEYTMTGSHEDMIPGNALNLTTLSFCYFGDFEDVIRLEGELIICNENLF